MTRLLLALWLTALGAQAPSDVVTEARGLLQAKQWDALDARVSAVGPDDPAWVRLASVVYSAGVARNDLPSAISRLRHLANLTTTPPIRAAALVVIGRAHRRQADLDAAVRVLEEAKAAAPSSDSAVEATGLIYEIRNLTPGLPAPAIDAMSRSGERVTLSALRGKAVVLVFWGST